MSNIPDQKRSLRHWLLAASVFTTSSGLRLWIEKLLALAPANPIGRLNKANAFATLGRMDEAIAMLRDLVRDYPQNLEAKLSLAPLLATTNANEEAVKVFTDAHRLAPNEPRALAGLARVLLRNNRLDDFRALRTELEQHDDDSQALLYLGRFAVLERRWADGERYLNRAVQLAPYDMEIHRDLSVCLYQIGRREDADQHAKRSREIEADLVQLEKQSTLSTMKPRDPEPRLEAARICLRNGDKSECLRWLRGARYRPQLQAHASGAGRLLRREWKPRSGRPSSRTGEVGSHDHSSGVPIVTKCTSLALARRPIVVIGRGVFEGDAIFPTDRARSYDNGPQAQRAAVIRGCHGQERASPSATATAKKSPIITPFSNRSAAVLD